MKTKLVAALLAAVVASLAAPAFASGYGPAPFYRPQVGAPDSQRGQSTLTLAAERGDAADTRHSYGGMTVDSSQSGSRVAVVRHDDLYTHH
jgi:hypothetical protein